MVTERNMSDEKKLKITPLHLLERCDTLTKTVECIVNGCRTLVTVNRSLPERLSYCKIDGHNHSLNMCGHMDFYNIKCDQHKDP